MSPAWTGGFSTTEPSGNLYVEYAIWNDGLDESQAGINISRRNINNPRYADDTTLMEESEKELNSPLMKVKEKSEKAGLKFSVQFSIWSHHFMASRRGKSEANRFHFGGEGSKITAVGDYSHEIKRSLLLRKKSYDKPRQCIIKQRHHFANKGLYSQSYGFSSSHARMWELDHKEGWAGIIWKLIQKHDWCPGYNDPKVGHASHGWVEPTRVSSWVSHGMRLVPRGIIQFTCRYFHHTVLIKGIKSSSRFQKRVHKLGFFMGCSKVLLQKSMWVADTVWISTESTIVHSYYNAVTF